MCVRVDLLYITEEARGHATCWIDNKTIIDYGLQDWANADVLLHVQIPIESGCHPP